MNAGRRYVASSPATSALKSVLAYAQKHISAPKAKSGTTLRANACARSLFYARTTCSGTSSDASAFANGRWTVRLATIGMKSLVPANAHLNRVSQVTIGTRNSASACVCPSHARTLLKYGTLLLAGANASSFQKLALLILIGTTIYVNACATSN